MQKYILGASPDKQTAMIRPFDDTGVTGDWREFNAGIVYLADEVDPRIEALEKALREIALLGFGYGSRSQEIATNALMVRESQ